MVVELEKLWSGKEVGYYCCYVKQSVVIKS